MFMDNTQIDLLYNLLHPRYKLFIKDIQKFIIISEDVIKKYIKQYLTNEKYDEAINFFNELLIRTIKLCYRITSDNAKLSRIRLSIS